MRNKLTAQRREEEEDMVDCGCVLGDPIFIPVTRWMDCGEGVWCERVGDPGWPVG